MVKLCICCQESCLHNCHLQLLWIYCILSVALILSNKHILKIWSVDPARTHWTNFSHVASRCYSLRVNILSLHPSAEASPLSFWKSFFEWSCVKIITTDVICLSIILQLVYLAIYSFGEQLLLYLMGGVRSDSPNTWMDQQREICYLLICVGLVWNGPVDPPCRYAPNSMIHAVLVLSFSTLSLWFMQNQMFLFSFYLLLISFWLITDPCLLTDPRLTLLFIKLVFLFQSSELWPKQNVYRCNALIV